MPSSAFSVSPKDGLGRLGSGHLRGIHGVRAGRALLAVIHALAIPLSTTAQELPESILDAFQFRNLGPFRTGAWVTDFAVPDTPLKDHIRTFYVATRNGGVWKTVNSGTTFEPVFDNAGPLTIGAVAVAPHDADRVGIIDLVMKPGQPQVLYAATYEKERYTWTYVVGGPGSGIHKTTDGGTHWTRLDGGLPEGFIGRIGIDVFRGDPNVVYAVVENANPRPGDAPGSMRVRGGWGEVYRSDDAGATWRMTHDPSVNVGGKAPYSFNILRIDPLDDQKLYVSSDAILVSHDGGVTWSGNYGPGASPLFRRMFGDVRNIWIDPQDGQRIFVGSDGGVNITYDGSTAQPGSWNNPIRVE